MKRAITVFVSVVGTALIFGAGMVLANPPGGPHTPVTICHKPGTPAEQTLVVDDDAVPGHLGHGDYLGACQGDTTTTGTTTTTETTTTTDTTTTDETTTNTTPVTPCPITPSNPTGSLPNPPGGKDGKPGNDACLPDPTTPEETVTTPTTPTEPSPENPVCSPGTHGTYPDCVPNEEPPVVTTPDVDKTPPVNKPDLEKDLDDQAKGNADKNPSPNARPTSSGELPRTGLSLWAAFILGGILTVAGAYLRGDFNLSR